MKGKGICATEGCVREATHKRIFTIETDMWGATEVSAGFCCKCLDELESESPPFLDLAVVARYRKTPES